MCLLTGRQAKNRSEETLHCGPFGQNRSLIFLTQSHPMQTQYARLSAGKRSQSLHSERRLIPNQNGKDRLLRQPGLMELCAALHNLSQALLVNL